MALVCIEDSDPWFREYDACEKLSMEIMEQLIARNKHPKSSQIYLTLSANIRIRLRQYNHEVQELKNKVDSALRSKTMYPFIILFYLVIKFTQIEILQSRDVKLQELQAFTNNFASSRSKLLTSETSAFADGGTNSLTTDDDDDKPLDTQISVADLITKKERVLQEQDKGLEELSKAIARQKEIGKTISNELNHQNEIIDGISNHGDTIDETLINTTRNIQTISYKNQICGYWIVIIFLFICIITVPYL
ncbi:Syntaxin-8 [Habropoda laboriosa]|uniref:Syntaxin-8 n=1 Tax=Habropoda laboriosa TaxID=597456 RepID=A0A0L7QVD8_9HYME|nr:PREDICTED: syntaxin-8 [Habropoda laboriosa]KOC62524.1 Syntaxin-8 [Habropoda laboriosa]